MKFKQYLALIADPDGFIPTPHFRWDIRKNTRETAREEAIAADILEQANPRENITWHFPWGKEEQMVLQQLWIHSGWEAADTMTGKELLSPQWRDIPTPGAKDLYTTVPTDSGELPVPNAVKEPGVVKGDFQQRIHEMLSQ